MPPLSPRIGQMRETLALQRNTIATSTGEGFQTDDWATYATVAGEYVQPPGGREAWLAAAVAAEVKPTFRIRTRPDVRAKHRLLWSGRTLEIHSVIPDRHVGERFLRLECGYLE